jgi:SnoaL-like domain
MSQQNVERVRQGYEAFARGDIDWLVEELMDEEVDWYPALFPLLGLGAVHGKEALERFFKIEIGEGLAEFAAVPGSIEDLGQSFLVQTHYKGTGRASGAPVILDMYSLSGCATARFSSFHDFNTRAEALEAVGLGG